ESADRRRPSAEERVEGTVGVALVLPSPGTTRRRQCQAVSREREMVEPDRLITRGADKGGGPCRLRYSSFPVRQHCFVYQLLKLLEPRHMGIAEKCQAVGSQG